VVHHWALPQVFNRHSSGSFPTAPLRIRATPAKTTVKNAVTAE
jgi:hypothetical protein